jgi:hypothetical protein
MRSGQPASEETPRELHVYDGRDRVGLVIQRAAKCDAFDASGVFLGTFKKLKSAVDAVNLSRSVFCIPDSDGRKDNSP